MRTIISAFIFASSLIAGTAKASEIAQSAPTLADLDKLGREIATKKCAHPERMAIEHIANGYEDVTDEIKTFYCSDYRVTVYEAHASNVIRELPLEVTVNHPTNVLPKNLSIGAKAGGVRAMLGKPYSESTRALIYSLSAERPGADTITFRLKGGRVDRIVWDWDVE